MTALILMWFMVSSFGCGFYMAFSEKRFTEEQRENAAHVVMYVAIILLPLSIFCGVVILPFFTFYKISQGLVRRAMTKKPEENGGVK